MGYISNLLNAMMGIAPDSDPSTPKMVGDGPKPLGTIARAQIDIGSFSAIATFPDLASVKARLGLFCIQRNYFVGDQAFAGQVTQVIAIAPRETVEVVTQVTRRVSREDEFEGTTEEETSNSRDTRDMLEISDVITKTLSNSSTSSTSASVSGTVAGISHTNSSTATETTTNQHSSKSVKEVVNKAADRMRRSVRIKVKNVQELTEVNSSRRQITNDTNKELNIAVRSALRLETVYVQSLRSQLCLELQLTDPGALLKNGNSLLIPVPQLPDIKPNFRATTQIHWPANPAFLPNGQEGKLQFEFAFPESAELDFSASQVGMDFVSVEAYDPAMRHPVNANNWFLPERLSLLSQSPGKCLVQFHIPPGVLESSASPFTGYMVGISVTLCVNLRLKISKQVYDAWYQQHSTALAQNAEARLNVNSRSAQALREEERLAVINATEAMVRNLLPHAPEVLEQAFGLKDLWYSIRESDLQINASGESFIQTAESKGAPMGYSLGWGETYACEADRLRNIFMKAQMATVYLPILPGMEMWFQEQIRTISFTGPNDRTPLQPDFSTLSRSLFERASASQRWLDRDGDRADPADVLSDTKTMSTHELDNLFSEATYIKDRGTPSELYPIVDRYRVTTPIDGFFYEVL